MPRVYLLMLLLLSIELAIAGKALRATAAELSAYPHFRHVDKAMTQVQKTLPPKLILLADEDFAPFSFRGLDGKLTGLSVQIALGACVDLKLVCEIKLLPFGGLVPALRAKQGDVVIAGPVAGAKATEGLIATKPYYFSSSQFVARLGVALAGVNPKVLAGRRLGFVQGSSQELFLKKNFERSVLVPLASEDAVFEALRTGGLDLAFVDSLHAGFWVKGGKARGCCQVYGEGFIDKASFTRGLSMVVRADDMNLRDALDAALDHLQENETTGNAFATYLPSSPF